MQANITDLFGKISSLLTRLQVTIGPMRHQQVSSGRMSGLRRIC